MSIVASAWASVLGMFAWAAYLYFHWSGVDTLPMPWRLTGRPTWYAARGRIRWPSQGFCAADESKNVLF